jgi:hypothetical protein
VQFPTETVRLYAPVLEVVTLVNTGFGSDDVKPFGPVQLNVVPLFVDTFSCMLPRAHMVDGLVTRTVGCVSTFMPIWFEVCVIEAAGHDDTST